MTTATREKLMTTMKSASASDMFTRIELITPDRARALLANMIRNRPLTPPRVTTMARDMAAGRWNLTHQGLALDHGGRLIDGQHRCHAIAQSGHSVWMAVAYNVAEETFVSFDIGYTRSAANIASLTMDVKQPKESIAAAKSLALILEKYMTQAKTHAARISNAEQLQLLAAFKDDIQSALTIVGKSFRKAALIAAVAYALPVDRARIVEWGEALSSRVGMTTTMAALCRASERCGSVRVASDKLELITVTLRAIEAHLTGREVSKLFTRGPNSRESALNVVDRREGLCVEYFRNRRRALGLPV